MCALCGKAIFEMTYTVLRGTLNATHYVPGCRSGGGDINTASNTASTAAGSQQTHVSNVDLLDGLVTTPPPQPLGFFTPGQPPAMMAGMSQVYMFAQQPGVIPVMSGGTPAAGMMQGNLATGFPETAMQGGSSSSTMMQMKMAASVQQQQQTMMMTTTQMNPTQSFPAPSLPVGIRNLSANHFFNR